jgi:hypothetical protein
MVAMYGGGKDKYHKKKPQKYKKNKKQILSTLDIIVLKREPIQTL